MSVSTSYTADGTFSSNYAPSDGTQSFVEIVGTTLRFAQTKTPASASATGIPGEMCYDGDYVYVCTGVNTWKRSALSSW